MKTAFITGAARGIGLAIAEEFFRKGWRIAMADILRDDLSAAAETLQQAGAEVLALPVDLSDLSAAEQAVAAAAGHFGGIDCLVNNAAGHDFLGIHEMTPASWHRVLQLNLTAPAFLAQFARPHLIASGQGSIINVASIDAWFGKGIAPAYVAAKGGLLSLTYDLASALAPHGVRAVAVSPGAIDTELSRDYADASGGSLTEDLRNFTEDLIPLRRWGRPEEIARLVVWLAGPEAGYITGTEIVADGGLMHNNLSLKLKQRMNPGTFP